MHLIPGLPGKTSQEFQIGHSAKITQLFANSMQTLLNWSTACYLIASNLILIWGQIRIRMDFVLADQRSEVKQLASSSSLPWFSLYILKVYGLPDKMIQAIKLLYQNTCAKVLSPDRETDEFDILAGVLQGDTLAPYLFTIVLDFIIIIIIEFLYRIIYDTPKEKCI